MTFEELLRFRWAERKLDEKKEQKKNKDSGAKMAA